MNLFIVLWHLLASKLTNMVLFVPINVHNSIVERNL